MTYSLWRLIRRIFLVSLLITAILVFGVIYYIEFELPDIDALNTVQLQVPLQVFTRDGKLIAQYGEKRRIPLPYNQIPKQLIDAVLATEDQRYFQHPGIDIPGLMRATVKLILTGRKEQGGSTITMQVARSFYLTRHKTFGRKLREILLALKINHKLNKQKILELYLNKIFLGYRAYGVAAAAEVYYGKPLNQLSLDQFAMLAGLPKAPSTLNPLANPEAAKKRRNHVLGRMLELHYIDEKTYNLAIKAPLEASYHDLQTQEKAAYVSELVRQQLEQMYGDAIYTDGFNVYTTIDSNLQNAANEAVHLGLVAYDQRHGYRGPERNLGNPTPSRMMEWKKILRDLPSVSDLEAAIVVQVGGQSITAFRGDGSLIAIPWSGLSWARKQIDADYLGRKPRTASEVLRIGDLIRITTGSEGWRLAQIPKAQAGLIALNPQDGQMLAMVGGFDYPYSKFNRITSAKRQPGSSFKPFIYSAALNKGYTLATVINDAPVVVENPYDNSLWRPQNDTHKFYGPTRLREALIHSRNVVSIRLLDLLGIPYTLKYAKNFGFDTSDLPASLSLALGTANVTPLQLANGYSIFANGGYRITPYVIDNIRNSQGQIIYQAKPATACPDCAVVKNGKKPNKPDPSLAPRVIDAKNAFLITSALHDVIQFGTATAARSLLRKDLAGKTGTTNNQVDAWFAGYNPDLVAVSWLGFDQPQSLHEYGAQAALPIWIEFMKEALKNKPEHIMKAPPGIVKVYIDPMTGSRASNDDPTAVPEFFMKPFVPGGSYNVEDQSTLNAENPLQPKAPSHSATNANSPLETPVDVDQPPAKRNPDGPAQAEAEPLLPTMDPDNPLAPVEDHSVDPNLENAMHAKGPDASTELNENTEPAREDDAFSDISTDPEVSQEEQTGLSPSDTTSVVKTDTPPADQPTPPPTAVSPTQIEKDLLSESDP